MTTTLYHGSTEDHGNNLTVADKGVFGGLFAADRGAAESHGSHLYAVTVDRVLTRRVLSYDIDFDVVKLACAAAAPHIDAAELADAMTESDFDEHGNDDVAGLVGESDPGDASWEAQRLLGSVARELGYDAVEMPDEHGTSYLVLPGAIFEKITD